MNGYQHRRFILTYFAGTSKFGGSMSFECYGFPNLDEWSLDGLGFVTST